MCRRLRCLAVLAAVQGCSASSAVGSSSNELEATAIIAFLLGMILLGVYVSRAIRN